MSDPADTSSPLSAEPVDIKVRPWTAMMHRSYTMLWASGFVAVVGEQMRRATDLWIVYELSGGSPLQLGLIGLAQAFPLFALGLFSGTLADLVDRKKMLFAGKLIRFLLGVLLAVLAVSGAIEIWHVYLLTLGNGVAMSMEQPARNAMIPAVLPRSLILNGMALQQGSRQASILIGPPLAAMVIDTWGIATAYVVHASLYPAALVLLTFVRSRPVERAGLRGFRLGQVAEGLRFVRRSDVLVSLIALDAGAIILTNFRVLTPIFAEEILGGDVRTFGLLMAAPAAGRLVGTSLMLLAGNLTRPGVVVLWVTAAYAIAIAVFALSRDVWLSWIALAAAGGTDGAGAITRNAIVQLISPDELRGRITSVNSMFGGGSPSLAQLLTGALAAGIGGPGALMVGAGLAGGLTLFAALKVRELVRFRV